MLPASAEPTDAPAGADASIPVFTAAMGGLLGLQEQAAASFNPAVRDREARRHGHELLATLAELQRLLVGPAEPSASVNATERLAGLVAASPVAADPALRQIVAAITLRSRIELARSRP
jgi:hypothetical protein